MSATHYLAVDLGAESGRVMLGTLKDSRLSLQEVHRFANSSISKDGSLFWDLPHLEKEILSGIEKAAQYQSAISGISTDSWGVDYVLLDAENQPLSLPFCYRDPRTAEAVKRLLKTIPFSEIYAETGIQFMAINTLYHFEAETQDRAQRLTKAKSFLNMADYINCRLGGVATSEESLASTTQLYDPQAHAWSEKLISILGVSPDIFPRIVPSGTVLGPLVDGLKTNAIFADTQVIASCSHDTGAAIAAVPAKPGTDWAYLSSGTWSLLGAELTEPVITEEARDAGFTNEVGLGGTIRFLKNIAGLWIVQECRRAWADSGEIYSYDDLTRLATEAGDAVAHLSLDDPRFVTFDEMPEKIAAYCRETGQPVPSTPGEYIRAVLESLAVCYAQTLTKLESLTGQTYDTLHIVGGGTRNDLLNQLTADAVRRTVVTGPVEATAIGNILIQALALGHIESSSQLREIVEASFPTRLFTPQSHLLDKLANSFKPVLPIHL